MRKINLIVIHCSAVKPDETSSAQEIDAQHRKDRRCKGIGYHYVVRRNGKFEEGRPEEQVGAHAGAKYNRHSIGICYEGGLDAQGHPADTRTPQQKRTIRNILVYLKDKYPEAKILGYNDLVCADDIKLANPCFNAAAEYDFIR